MPNPLTSLSPAVQASPLVSPPSQGLPVPEIDFKSARENLEFFYSYIFFNKKSVFFKYSKDYTEKSMGRVQWLSGITPEEREIFKANFDLIKETKAFIQAWVESPTFSNDWLSLSPKEKFNFLSLNYNTHHLLRCHVNLDTIEFSSNDFFSYINDILKDSSHYTYLISYINKSLDLNVKKNQGINHIKNQTKKVQAALAPIFPSLDLSPIDFQDSTVFHSLFKLSVYFNSHKNNPAKILSLKSLLETDNFNYAGLLDVTNFSYLGKKLFDSYRPINIMKKMEENHGQEFLAFEEKRNLSILVAPTLNSSPNSIIKV